MDDEPRLYTDLAEWFPLLTPPEDYRTEAAAYLRLMREGALRPVRTALELGSGGGHNAHHLKAHLALTLVDRSDAMLAVGRRLNPDLEHLRGDMRSVRLGRVFDAVFVHDAASHLLTPDDVARLATTCRTHLREGGVALACPDHLRETFVPSVHHGGSDAADGTRGVRYLEWVQARGAHDDTYLVQMAYLLRDGAVTRHEHETLRLGALPRATWLDAFRAAGFADVRTAAVPGAESEPGEAILAVAGAR